MLKTRKNTLSTAREERFGNQKGRSTRGVLLAFMIAAPIAPAVQAFDDDGVPTPFTDQTRGWAEWGLVNVHGRPKFVIADPRDPGRGPEVQLELADRVSSPISNGDEN